MVYTPQLFPELLSTKLSTEIDILLTTMTCWIWTLLSALDIWLCWRIWTSWLQTMPWFLKPRYWVLGIQGYIEVLFPRHLLDCILTLLHVILKLHPITFSGPCSQVSSENKPPLSPFPTYLCQWPASSLIPRSCDHSSNHLHLDLPSL